jgi:serine/threonine protein kinase
MSTDRTADSPRPEKKRIIVPSRKAGSSLTAAAKLRRSVGAGRKITLKPYKGTPPQDGQPPAKGKAPRYRLASKAQDSAGDTIPTFFSKRYKLSKAIGHGGMSTVYKAQDKLLNSDVAIKFLPARLTRNKAAITQFKREASLAMQLSHEHIVKLHNLDVDRNRMFLIMEYVNGTDFRRILNDSCSLPIGTVAQMVHSCALALDYAHEREILHLDLKPSNLMLSNNSILKIVDFGTAQRMKRLLASSSDTIEGTPPYISPEQITGEPLSFATDVYSLGATAYECLCGRPLFPFDAGLDTLLNDEPIRLDNVPDDIAAVIATAVAKRPEDRWHTAGEFDKALSSAYGAIA